jgi:hypothetical protein
LNPRLTLAGTERPLWRFRQGGRTSDDVTCTLKAVIADENPTLLERLEVAGSEPSGLTQTAAVQDPRSGRE